MVLLVTALVAGYLTSWPQYMEQRLQWSNLGTPNVKRELAQARALYNRYPDSSKIQLERILHKSRTIHYAEGVKLASYDLMLYHYFSNDQRKSIAYGQLFLQYSQVNRDDSLIKYTYLYRGAAYQNLERYKEALMNYHIVLSLPDNHKKGSIEPQKTLAYSYTAFMLSRMGQNEKAFYYQHIADSLDEEDKNASSILYTWAQLYHQAGQTDKAIALLDSALRLKNTDAEYGMQVRLQKLFYLPHINRGTEAQRAFEELKPLLLIDTLPRRRKQQIILAGGFAYYSTKNYPKALEYLQLAYQEGNTLGSNERRQVIHFLSHTYYRLKNYKAAYMLHLRYHDSEDSIKNNRMLTSTNELETKYRTATKDRMIAQERLKFQQSQQIRYRERVMTGTALACLGLLLLLLYIRYRFIKQKKDKLEARQQLTKMMALMEGQETERSRVAQELHDGVNSSLAATYSYLQTVEQKYPEVRTEHHFLKMKELLLSTSDEIRAIAHNLTPHTLIREGLMPAIEIFCQNLFAALTGIEVQYYGQEQNHDEHSKLLLYRVAQELLHNIYKHARATEIIVVVGFESRQILLTIEDNGTGISKEAQHKAGIGLANIQKRLEQRGGSLNIESEPDRGTVVHVCLPLAGPLPGTQDKGI